MNDKGNVAYIIMKYNLEYVTPLYIYYIMYIYNGIQLYKKKELLSLLTTWMNLEDTMLNEIMGWQIS
jgi:hypothetical protein